MVHIIQSMSNENQTNEGSVDPNAIHVDASNYRELAGRTERVPVQELPAEFSRVEKCAIEAVLGRLIQLSGYLDLLKRHVVYGKTLPDWKLEYLTRDVRNPDIREESFSVPTLVDESAYRLLHAVMGKFTEAGELAEEISNSRWSQDPDKEIDRTNLIEEIGDSWWYDQIIARMLDFQPEDAMRANIRKLATRFGSQFSEDAARERDLEAERANLESNTKEEAGPHYYPDVTEVAVLERLDDIAAYYSDRIGNNFQKDGIHVRILAGPDERGILLTLAGRSGVHVEVNEAECDPSWPRPHFWFHDIPISMTDFDYGLPVVACGGFLLSAKPYSLKTLS